MHLFPSERFPTPGAVVTEMENKRRRPGILDRIQTTESAEAAHLLWQEFLDHADPSQKTINKAERLLLTLDFPSP